MNNYLKEIKAVIILILFFSIIPMFAYFLMKTNTSKLISKIFIIYFCIGLISYFINSVFKNKLLNKIVRYIHIPGGAIYSILLIILPFSTLFLHLIFYLLISFLTPEFFFYITKAFDLNIINSEKTLSYIKITSTVFIAVLLNQQIRWLVYKISIAMNYSKKFKVYEFDKLTDYLLSEKNIRCIIYSLYVFILIIINFNNFEEATTIGNSSDSQVILQSFVTFIALDRTLVLLKQLEFKPSDLLKLITHSIYNKFQDLSKKTEL